jgi:hypothetical protein
VAAVNPLTAAVVTLFVQVTVGALSFVACWGFFKALAA